MGDLPEPNFHTSISSMKVVCFSL